MTLTTQSMTAELPGAERTRRRDFSAPSSLAGLLDRFTRDVTNAASHTVGEFAATLEALHGELNLLTHQFTARKSVVDDLDDVDFDDIFPSDSNIPAELDPAYHGIEAAEELEHHCRQISQGS